MRILIKVYLQSEIFYFTWNQLMSRCDKNRNLCTSVLSHFFGKNFVKATFLLEKLLNRWFDEIFLVRVNLEECEKWSFLREINFWLGGEFEGPNLTYKINLPIWISLDKCSQCDNCSAAQDLFVKSISKI